MKTILSMCAVLVLFAGCGSDEPTRSGERVWMAIDPTQCLTSPWASAWLAANGNNYDSYPAKDRPGPEETAVITAYLGERGIHAFSVAYTYFDSPIVCAACSCPEGYTVFVQVDAVEIPGMEEVGFRRDAPGS